MRRIRSLTSHQLEALSVDFPSLSAAIASHYPQKSEMAVAQLTSLLAAAAMLESESLLTHAMDTVAIIVQAEARAFDRAGPDE